MLAVVVDDHDMGVTHVIRGDDHLNNAFRQLAHHPGDGLARAGLRPCPADPRPGRRQAVQAARRARRRAYRDELGILPEALFNYLLRLGWGHGDDEIISREEAVHWFDLDHVGRSPSRFDHQEAGKSQRPLSARGRSDGGWPAWSRRGSKACSAATLDDAAIVHLPGRCRC